MATEKERTPMEKLKGIAMEFTALKKQLPEEHTYHSNIEQCLKWCHDLEEHLTKIDDTDDDENEND